MRTCSIEDCTNVVEARGWCNTQRSLTTSPTTRAARQAAGEEYLF